MKHLSRIFTVIALSLSTVLSVAATEKKPVKTNNTSELRTEIVSLIGKNFPIEVNKEAKAKVYFVVNNSNELVVISVNSKTEGVASFVKSKLNYKKIVTKGIKKGEIYSINLKIEKES